MKSANRFIHLHTHSYYSFLRGTISPADLVDKAVELGFPSVALTDTNGVYGAIKFYKKAQEKGIKPIIGAEVDHPEDRRQRIVVLAKNSLGYENLCRLLTYRHMEKDSFLWKTALNYLSEDNFLLTDTMEILKEGQTHKNLRHALRGEVILTLKNKVNNRSLYRYCKKHRIPCVATGDVYLLKKEDWETHKILRCIDNNSILSKLPDEELDAQEDNYFRNVQEMADMLNGGEELLEESVRIAAECNLELPLGSLKFPKAKVDTAEESFSYLSRIAWEGLKKQYNPLTKEAVKRFAYELETIEELGFSDYFLVVHDILKEANRRNIPHIGRGSAANSIIAYCLGITEVDPLKYNLYFERFLNRERKSPPDIDLDFCWKSRDGLLRWVYERYGAAHVAMINEIVTFRIRGAFREVAKVYGIPEEEISKMSRSVSYYSRDWGHTQKVFPASASLNWDSYDFILQAAKRITGFPHHLSIHVGGIVITREPITDYTPLEKSANGLTITQYDMYCAEDLGLVKIDLLAQRSLSVLRDCMLMVEKRSGKTPPVDDADVVFNDAATRAIIRDGTSMGCFYIESPAMRNLLKKLKIDTFEMLTAASSVIRPGVAESGMMKEFIQRHQMEDPSQIQYIHPKMKELLGETYGVMIYQEDVIKVAHHVAGISLSEADLLRRAMSGKSRSKKGMAQLRDDFIRSAIQRDVDIESALEIWRQIESFCGYSFCKAHSASFARVSFKVAFLKAHYPAAFMACVLSNQGGFYHTSAYIEESKRMGLAILPPDINKSNYPYEGQQDYIRVGLQQIAEVSYNTKKAVLEARDSQGEFKSLPDFLYRVDAGKKDLEILIQLGLFDSLHKNRAQMLWLLETAYEPIKKSKQNHQERMTKVESSSLITALPQLKDYSEEHKRLLELKYLGFSCTHHFLDFFEEAITNLKKRFHLITSSQIKDHKGQYVRIVGWAIAMKVVHTKNQENPYMKFLSLEDQEGTFEASLFPKVYAKYAQITASSGPFLVEGRVDEDFGVPSIQVRVISKIDGNLHLENYAA